MSYTLEVKKFTDACHSNLPQTPRLLTPSEVAFITKMVNDELKELAEATDITGQADALVDATYYIHDQAVRSGIDLDPLFSIVSKANQSKIVDGKVIRREDGKILKPAGWVDPKPLLQKEMKDQENYGSWNKVVFQYNGKPLSIKPKNRIGLHTEYYESGQTKELWYEDENGVQGEKISYYCSGKVMSRYNHKNGKPEGQGVSYEEDGTISAISTYKDGVRMSLSTFDRDGSLIYSGA